MAQADTVQPSEFLAYNYPGATINNVQNNAQNPQNWVGWLFDYDQGTGNYKGAATIAENQDGTCTFWFWDVNFIDTDLVFANYQFTWYSPNVPGAAIDVSGLGQNQQYFMAAAGVPVQPTYWYLGNVVNNFANTSVARPQFDSVNVVSGGRTYPVFRARLQPSGGPGTQFTCSNIYHLTSGGGQNNTFNDGGPFVQNFTLYWKKPAPPPPNPTLVSVTPVSGINGTPFSLVTTNMPVAGYSLYLSPTKTPLSRVNPIGGAVFYSNGSLVTGNIPLAVSPASYNLFASNGNYNTNSLTFSVTASSNHGPPATGSGPKPPPVVVPPKVVGISVTPSTITLLQGASQRFAAYVLYATGAPAELLVGPKFTASQINWTVTDLTGDGSIGTTSGVFVAGNSGKCNINIAFTNTDKKVYTATANVTIAQPPTSTAKLISLTLNPLNSTVEVGKVEQFTYYGTNSANAIVYPPVQWSLVNPTGQPAQASINARTGLFSALNLTPGLTAKWWSSSVATPPINLPPAHTGEISRTPDAITSPTTITYSSTGTLPPAAVTGTNCWYTRITGYIVPTITGKYIFTMAADDGANLNIAGYNLILDVEHSHPVTTLTSGQINLTAGVHYPIIVEWSQLSGSYGLTLNWTPPGGKSVVVPASVFQTDSSNDVVTVTCSATDGSGVKATTTVKVIGTPLPPPPSPGLTTLVINPSSAVVRSGATQQFKSQGYDQYGNPVPAKVTWSVSDNNGSGTIDSATGLFLGEIAGNSITITATANDSSGIQGNAKAVVLAGTPVRLTITPPSANVIEGGTNQFTAIAYDRYNNVVNLSNMVWGVAGGIGTVSSVGLFTATSIPGVGKVIVTAGSLQAAATVNVLVSVGGLAATTFPQKPFARIRLRGTIDPPVVIDTRTRGGGLRDDSQLVTTGNLWWDLERWEGLPFTVGGVFFANAYQPNTIQNQNTYLDRIRTRSLINTALAKVQAPHFFAAISPLSNLLFTTYPGNVESQAISPATDPFLFV